MSQVQILQYYRNYGTLEDSEEYQTNWVLSRSKEEEVYLRVQTYKALAKQIDNALESTIHKRLDELVLSIHACFAKF